MFKYRLYKTLRFFHLISKKNFKKKTTRYQLIKTKEYQAIAKSKLFDKKWYLEQNPDVKAAKADPILHYLEYGWKEARECTPYFDGKQYLQMYPDIKEANMNPLAHWLLHGQFENRYAETKAVKINHFQKLWQKLHTVAVYPITVYEECQRLEFELKNMK